MSEWKEEGRNGHGQFTSAYSDNNIFRNDFNMMNATTNSISFKSNGSTTNFSKLPDKWQNYLNSTNSIPSFVQNTQASFSSILEQIKTLSVRSNNMTFGTLPVDWIAQAGAEGNASPSVPQLQSPMPNGSQHEAYHPFPGDKRHSETVVQQLEQHTKFQRMNPPELMETNVKQEIECSTHSNSTNLTDTPSEVLNTDVKSNAAIGQSSNSSNTRWNSWSHEEEVFLVVAVLDRFFRRGSLASSGKGANAQGVDCWAEIKAMYDKICAAWGELAENKVLPPLIARSTSALSRHFKIMKVRAVEGDKHGTHDGNFRKYLREWDTKFNINGRLIAEEY